MAYMQNYIIEHCFVGGRLNNGQVLAKTDHRINHSRNKGKEMSFKDVSWNSPIPGQVGLDYKAFNEDAGYLLQNLSENNISPDLCYIDPPYGGDQSDYSTMFDFIEGYQWLTSKDQRNQPVDSYYDWCKEKIERKAKARKKFINSKNYVDHFDELIKATVDIPWIAISYNDSSWGSIDEMTTVVNKYRKDAIVKEFSYSYKYRSGENSKGVEYLILSERRE